MAESQKENQCATAAAAAASVSNGSWERKGGDGSPMITSTITDLTTAIMPSFIQHQQQPRSRSSRVGESPSPTKRKSPPELVTLTNRQQQQQHFNGATSQSSKEKIYYSKQQQQQPAAMNNNTTTSTYLRMDAKHDAELEKAIRVSQQQFREEQKRLKDYETAQLEVAMKESVAVAKSSPCVNRQQQKQKVQKRVVDDNDVIVLDDDNDDGNKKLPAKQSLADVNEDKKMPSSHSIKNNKHDNDDDDLQKAIRLSLEETKKPSKTIVDTNNHDDENNTEFHCRVLSRNEFEDVIYPLVERNGGFAKIEKGKMVQKGNRPGDVKNNKSQSRAQYGRYMIESFWKVLDVLEGKVGVQQQGDDDDDDEAVNDESDGKIDAKSSGKPSLNDSVDANKQEDGQPQNKKITALTDIGHGIGLQVMQAGWTLDVDSRGIELMKGRHEIAQVIYDGVIDGLRNDPPDSTRVDLRLDNLVHCVFPPPGKSERDEELRRFVLFQDKPESIQKGLVIFANNAMDVFAARSNDSGSGACLDEHLAELFGNMKVGGRCVTLTDIRCHLTSRDDARWYHYESFQSGVGAVSWSPNKSVAVHVLTKISEDWVCSNEENVIPCPPSGVVDEDGRLRTKCLYCLKAPRRKQERRRRKRKRYSPEDGD